MPSRLRFRCLTLAKDARYEKIALILQKQLYEIGVDIEIEALPGKELIGRLSSGQFEMLLMERTSGRSLAWTYLTFHSSQNPSGYTAADKVLEQLRRTTADAGVRTAVSDLQQIFHDDPPAIFILWPKVARVVSSKFASLTRSGQGRHEQDSGSGGWPHPANETHHLEIRSPHRQRRHRAAGRCTARFRSSISDKARESSVSEGNQRVADQVAEQIGQYIDQQHAGAEVGGPHASRHRARTVAAVAGAQGLSSSTSRSFGRSRSSAPAAG